MRRIGALKGVVGLQVDNARFDRPKATEAFAPPSDTRQRALFLFEELPPAGAS
jgi:iron complex outermembrane receptor protein